MMLTQLSVSEDKQMLKVNSKVSNFLYLMFLMLTILKNWPSSFFPTNTHIQRQNGNIRHFCSLKKRICWLFLPVTMIGSIQTTKTHIMELWSSMSKETISEEELSSEESSTTYSVKLTTSGAELLKDRFILTTCCILSLAAC